MQSEDLLWTRLFMQSQTHSINVEIRAVLGPYSHFQDSLFFFMLQIVLDDFGCMFGPAVLLQKTFGANQTPRHLKAFLLYRASLQYCLKSLHSTVLYVLNGMESSYDRVCAATNIPSVCQTL